MVYDRRPDDRRELVRDTRYYRGADIETMSHSASADHSNEEKTKSGGALSDVILFFGFLFVVAWLGYGAQSFVSSYLEFGLNNIKNVLFVGAVGVIFVVYLLVKRSEKQIGPATTTPRKNTAGKTTQRTVRKTTSKRKGRK